MSITVGRLELAHALLNASGTWDAVEAQRLFGEANPGMAVPLVGLNRVKPSNSADAMRPSACPVRICGSMVSGSGPLCRTRSARSA